MDTSDDLIDIKFGSLNSNSPTATDFKHISQRTVLDLDFDERNTQKPCAQYYRQYGWNWMR